MQIHSIKILSNKVLPSTTKAIRVMRKAAISTALCSSALIPASCFCEYAPPQKNNTYINTENVKEMDEKILPDTVSQPIIQNISNIHEKINSVFSSLKITEPGRSIQDIKSLEFEDIEGNKYKYTDIQKIDEGYEFAGTVKHNGMEEKTYMKFSDGYKLIQNSLVCMETSFNKKHNLSMIYQNQWRLGNDGRPERRLFQNRTNKRVDWIDPKEYYPYDSYNVFAIRRTKDAITSKVLKKERQFTADDEIQNIKVIYK